MKLTIAALLLSPVLASKAAKYGKAKFPKAKAKGAKSAGRYGSSMSMSASMSVGPPPITLKECGESFTNEKVVLSKDLNCGSLEGDQQECNVTMDGPLAELNCRDNTISQIATPPSNYFDGPYRYGICLLNGAKAINCNVEQFRVGIDVRNDNNNSEGEVVNSVLNSNGIGIQALFNANSTLTIENTDASKNAFAGLSISTYSPEAKLIVKGEVTVNSNENVGVLVISLSGDTNLEINLETDSTLNSCENGDKDISGFVTTSATATFSGDGYFCDEDKVLFSGFGDITLPVCQEACPPSP